MKLILCLAITICFYLFESQAGSSPRYWGNFRLEVNLGPNLLVAKHLTDIPKKLSKKFPLSAFNHFGIDLNQDGTEDYIVESKTKWRTCFVKSDLTLQYCEKLNFSKADGFAYEYFVSQGKNKMLLLFDFTGDEDSSSYSLKQFDPKTWKWSKVMRIFPFIDSMSKERQGIYWGYPWDIKDILVKLDGPLKIQATLAHNPSQFSRESDEKGPAILFTGIATQGGKIGPYDNLRSKFRFETIEDLKNSLSANGNK